MSETLRALVPSLVAPLLPDFFDQPAIDETRATCSDCAMCDKSGAAKPEAHAGAEPELETDFFRPDIKCCTYHPTLPNYLAGAVLDDPSPDLAVGRERLREKLRARIGVTPKWLAAPRKFLVLLEASRRSSFGRSEALLCPYYVRDGGLCSIWRHREAICATFFCKHVRGATGHAFWSAFKAYLTHVERALALHAARAVGPTTTDPTIPRTTLTLEDLEDRPPNDAVYAGYWQEWAGREEEFYVACARHVRALGKAEVAALVDDDEGRGLLAEAQRCYVAATAPKLEPKLVMNRHMRVLPASGGVGVTTYSRYDSMFLSESLYEVLKELTKQDQPVPEALERLRVEHQVELPESLLLEMQLFGVVTPPDPERDAR